MIHAIPEVQIRIGTGGGLNRGAFQDFVNFSPSLSPQCIDMVVVAWWKLTPTKSRACCGGCGDGGS